jgi:hypothetical protein
VQTRPLFVIREQIPPLIVVGETPDAFRRIGIVQGGSFEGDRMSGDVVTGNDWQVVRKDNCLKLDVRLVLKTTDEALIVMTYQAFRTGPAGVLEKLGRMAPFIVSLKCFEDSVRRFERVDRTKEIDVHYRGSGP